MTPEEKLKQIEGELERTQVYIDDLVVAPINLNNSPNGKDAELFIRRYCVDKIKEILND